MAHVVAFYAIDIASGHFIFSLDGNKYSSHMLEGTRSELIKWHGWDEAVVSNEFAAQCHGVWMQPIFVVMGIHIIKIMNVLDLGKCDSEGIHGMVPVVITF